MFKINIYTVFVNDNLYQEMNNDNLWILEKSREEFSCFLVFLGHVLLIKEIS